MSSWLLERVLYSDVIRTGSRRLPINLSKMRKQAKYSTDNSISSRRAYARYDIIQYNNSIY